MKLSTQPTNVTAHKRFACKHTQNGDVNSYLQPHAMNQNLLKFSRTQLRISVKKQPKCFGSASLNKTVSSRSIKGGSGIYNITQSPQVVVLERGPGGPARAVMLGFLSVAPSETREFALSSINEAVFNLKASRNCGKESL